MSSNNCDVRTESLGPFLIDYEHLYHCQFSQYNSLFIFLLLLWIVYLTRLLGNTASNYFSPTLGSICVKLNLSHSLAGVTFLAFGNGAPDVFSSFASVAGSADILVGVGALLGGSVFISTVVVGSVAILCPSQVQGGAFLRDVGFHLLAILLVLLLAVHGSASLYLALGLVILYASYCGLVLWSVTISNQREMANKERRNKNRTSTSAQIQAAFWHKSDDRVKTSSTNAQNRNAQQQLKSVATDAETKEDVDNTYGYKFLILEEDPLVRDSEINGGKKDDEYCKGGDEEEGEVTINLSGGLISAEFDSEVYDDYFSSNALRDVHGGPTSASLTNSSSASYTHLYTVAGGSLHTPRQTNGINSQSQQHSGYNEYGYTELRTVAMVDGDSRDGTDRVRERRGLLPAFDAVSLSSANRDAESGVDWKDGVRAVTSAAALTVKNLLGTNLLQHAKVALSEPLLDVSGAKYALGDDVSDPGSEDQHGVDYETDGGLSDIESDGLGRDNLDGESIPIGILLQQQNKRSPNYVISSNSSSSSLNIPRLHSSIPIQRRSQYQNTVRALYWQHLLVRRRLQRSIWMTSWRGLSWPMRLAALADLPAITFRDLTIPTVDPELWSKPYATLHPIACPLFVCFVLGGSSYWVGIIPLPALIAIVGVPGSILVFLTTHYSYPPRGQLVAAMWVLSAFAMCIFWIYLLAGELVCCLTAAGHIFNIPPAFLGLTVLAWGNSMGDFFSNVSLARKGYGEMALAGSYGSPLFDLLIGLGGSLLYVCVRHYPTAFPLKLDVTSYVSLGFAIASLLSTIAVVSHREFRYEKYFGYYLLALYAVYTLTQCALLAAGTG